MHDDVTEETKPGPKGSRGTYPPEIRQHYVELFLASQPISQREFARKYGFNRKSLMKWLRVYAGIPPKESMNRHPRKASPKAGKGAAKASGRKPVPRPAGAAGGGTRPKASLTAGGPMPMAGQLADRKPPACSKADDVRTITIPYMEYMELLALKTKLNAVRAVCQ